MTRLLYRVGGSAARRPWRVLSLWLLATVAAFALAGSAGGPFRDNYTMPGTESQYALDLLRDRFPEQAGAGSRVLVHTEKGRLPESTLEQVRERLAELPLVVAAAPPVLTPDGRTAMLTVLYDRPVYEIDEQKGYEELQEAAAPAVAAGLQVEYGGEMIDQLFEQGKSEMIGFGLAGLILLIAFGSALAAGLPLAIAAIGLGIGMSLVTVLAAFTEISTIAPTIAGMVGIGVGIDYALIIVSRHRQQLLEGVPVARSIAMANATAGRSVVFAGMTVLIAICGLAFSGVPNFVMMGVSTAVVVAVAMIAAVTLLPALLGLAKHRVVPRRLRRKAPADVVAKQTLTTRWADHASRHPWRYGIASLVALLAMAAPVFAMQLGQSDAGSNPSSSTARRAYDLVTTGFGAGANGPLTIAVDLKKTSLDGLPERIGAIPGIASVAPPRINEAGDAAVILAYPTTGPQDRATDDLVTTLRSGALPDGAYVTGATAGFMDFNQRLQDRLPLVIGIVVGASFLLLVLVFRSIVAPLKAALMNLLSIGAAYGAIVALFQWGWGTTVLGLEQAVPVSAFVPMFMFAILFGLSMDYEVFLLGRVREEWDRTLDSRGSVVAALGSTGRVITSAALIMTAVFAGFATNEVIAVKMMGVGMAVAIFVDATIVRLVLVPATMVLLGRWNWWLPGWLDRLLPASAVHAPVALPAPRDAEREREPVLV